MHVHYLTMIYDRMYPDIKLFRNESVQELNLPANICSSASTSAAWKAFPPPGLEVIHSSAKRQEEENT